MEIQWRLFLMEVIECPNLNHARFCGNIDITGAAHKPVGSSEFYEVICVECGARIRRSSKRKAVEAWNRRTESR